MNKKICFFIIVFVLFNNLGVFANPNSNQATTTYLNMAVFNGDLKMAESEIEKGADVNRRGEDGWTPLITAVHYGYIDIVKLLISNGADPNIKETFQGNTPLHEAVFWDQPVEFARVIIGSGNVDVNIKNVYGLTPLHYVASNDTKDDNAYAELLINSGADVNVLDNFGVSPFHTAVSGRREYMARLMIENGAEINKIGPNGRIALHDSAEENSKEITELLILHGGNMQAKEGASGNTPLHQAAWYNGFDAAKVLVDYGADWNIKNNDGDTPLAVAQKSANNTGKVAEFLKEVSNGKYKPALHKIPVKQYNMGISDWAKAPVKNLKSYNIIPNSLSNQNLSRKQITREEVTELLMSLQQIIDKEMVKSTSNNPFKDVENPKVLEAYELGIISGISSDKFNPSGNLTREQMVTMIVKLLEKNGIDIKIKSVSPSIMLEDFNRTSFWAKDYMVFALNNGIIRGLSDKRIEPQGLLTREQALVIVNTVAIKYGFIENKVSTTS